MKLLKGETGIYFNTILRSLGMNLVSIFIPIYIYKLTGKFENAFLFYGLYHLFVILTALPTGWITQKIGVDLTSVLGSILRSLFILFLILGRQNNVFLALSAIFYGITINFCWLPYHYTVVGAEDGDGYFGKETSLIMVFEKIAASLGPFLGGLIIVGFGFNLLYGLAIFLILFSGLPMFFDTFVKKGMHFNVKRIKQSFFEKENRKFVIAFTSIGIKDAVLSAAWPLFVFSIVKNKYEVIGGIETAALLVSLALLWRLGKWIDEKGEKILKCGIILNSFIWLIRSFLMIPLTVFLSNIAYGFGRLLIWAPFNALIYKEMLKKRKLEFLILREITIHSGGFIGCLLILGMIKLGAGWFWIFGLGTLGLSGVSFVLRRQE